MTKRSFYNYIDCPKEMLMHLGEPNSKYVFKVVESTTFQYVVYLNRS